MRPFRWQQVRRDRVPRPPHVEVEVRFRLDDGADVLRQLRGSGIRFGKAVLQDDQAYGPEGWDYGQSRIGVTFARLRTSDVKHLFTVKRPLTDVQTCIEHECFVSDRKAMHEAIQLMGFRPTIRIVKRRALAQKGLYTFCLDYVVGLGIFLEVERLAASDDDTDAARAEIESFVAAAGIAATRCVDTYDGLLRALESDAGSMWQPASAAVAAA